MTTREASQRNEASIAMSPAMETQDDSVDLSYLKQVALEVGNEHPWTVPTAINAADTQKGCPDEVHKHETLPVNVLVATEMASKQQSYDADALPQFSYQQNVSTDAFRQLTSRREPWNAVPRFSATAMIPTDSSSGDTQPISQSVYDNILKQGNLHGQLTDRQHLNGLETSEDVTTQQSLRENDTGHLDLLEDLEDTLPVGKSSEDGPVSAADDADSSPARYQQFPESQRFVDRTPQIQRNTNGSINTPSLSLNPFTQTNKTPASVMALSQLFNATQALSSPSANIPRPELSSDMPSPNLPVQSRETVSSIFSPIQTTSPVPHSGCVGPRATYVSMKESQEVRARLERQSLSVSNHPTDNFSDDDILNDEDLLQRRLRQRQTENELRRQFECVTAPPRPSSRRVQHRGTSMLSRSGPTDADTKDTLLSLEGNARNVVSQLDIGPESELETEQEDEDAVILIPSSQAHVENEEDDKENVESSCPHSSNPTALAHNALSQALVLEEGPPTPRASSSGTPGLIVRESQPSNSHPITIVSDRSGSSEERILNSQLSAGGVDGTQTDVRHVSGISDVVNQEPSTPLGPDSRVKCSPARSITPESTDNARKIMQPPKTLTQVPASFSPRSKSASPGIRNSSRTNLSQIGNRETGLDGPESPSNDAKCQMDGDINEDTPMLSFIFETPAPRAVKGFQHTIPETSPSNQQALSSALRYSYSNPESNRVAPDSDGDLPTLSHINSQNGRRVGATGWSRKSKSNQFLSILSSPSGRPRRSMTDIALEKSPQQTSPDIPLEDISLLTAEDNAFQELVIDSDNHAPKRRKANSGRGILSSSRLNMPRFQSRRAVENVVSNSLDETDIRETDGHAALDFDTGNMQTLRTRTKTNHSSKSVWEVEDSPPRKVQNREALRATRQAQEPSKTQNPRADGKKHSVAQAVVINSKTSSSPTPTERIPSDPPTIVDNPGRAHTEATGNVSPDIFDFSNQVFAFFNGQPHGYYPATCVGMSNDIGRQRYLVLFEDAETPDELDITSVKKLDLKVNDTVKVFSLNLPKIPYRVVGLTDKLDANTITQQNTGRLPPLTDIHGHASVILAPKQERKLANGQQTVTVPISKIYLDKNLWSRLGVRTYSFNASILSNSISRLQTPTDCGITSFTPVLTRTPRKETSALGIFSGMAFAVSYTHNEKELSRLETLIFKNGGRILKEGFDELFDLPSPSSLLAGDDHGHSLRLTPRAEQIGFACLITDNYSRRPKYMQALALNLPCLAGRWVINCTAKRAIIDWEPYLLAAGPSMVLQKAVKSRILSPYPAATARFSQTIHERPKLLDGQSVFIVTSRGISAEQRKPYAFFTYALGPDKVFHVQDVETAIQTLNESQETALNGGRDSSAKCVWIYVGDEEAAKTARKLLVSFSGLSAPNASSVRGRGRPPKKRKKSSDTDDTTLVDGVDEYCINGQKVRILDNEYICQVLIFGSLFDGWLAIQHECHLG